MFGHCIIYPIAAITTVSTTAQYEEGMSSAADNQEGEPGGVARRRDDADVDFGSASDVVRSLRLERELRRLAPGLNRYDSRKTDSSIQWNTDKLLKATASRRATAFGEANETTDGCSSDDNENEAGWIWLPQL